MTVYIDLIDMYKYKEQEYNYNVEYVNRIVCTYNQPAAMTRAMAKFVQIDMYVQFKVK